MIVINQSDMKDGSTSNEDKQWTEFLLFFKVLIGLAYISW